MKSVCLPPLRSKLVPNEKAVPFAAEFSKKFLSFRSAFIKIGIYKKTGFKNHKQVELKVKSENMKELIKLNKIKQIKEMQQTT